MKAEDFWKYICGSLDYRFFAGVACPGFDLLYRKMNPELMHYVPSANEKIALGLVMGAATVGVKSAVLLDVFYLNDMINTFSKLKKYGLPFLILAYKSEKTNVDCLSIKSNKDIEKILSKAATSESVSIVTIDQGVIE